VKTSQGLVTHAHALIGSPYLWGTVGRVVTKSSLKSLFAQYPDYYNQENRKARALANDIGKIGVDCCGLIKSYMFTSAPGKPVTRVSNKMYQNYDKNVGELIKHCNARDPIATIPEIPGLLVFQGTHHVGIYIGKGKVIEAKGFNYGVQETLLKDEPWDQWGELSWIQYNNVKPQHKAILKTEFKPYIVYVTPKLAFIYIRQAPNGLNFKPAKTVKRNIPIKIYEVQSDIKHRKWGRCSGGWVALWLTEIRQ